MMDENGNAKLSDSARQELREILSHEVDETTMEKLSDEDIDHFGLFLLTVHAEAAKLSHEKKTTQDQS